MAPFSVEPIDDHVSMIDVELFGIKRVGAVFLISGGQSCLVDSGTRKEAKRLIQALDSVGAFPPDKIILTHSHWDHTQGVPTLSREAKACGKQISVMASEKAIPNLTDQSWNSIFEEKEKFENIDTVEALKDGQVVDLEGVEIEIMDFSGHCADDIALYNRKNKTIIAGDSLGYQVEKSLIFPPFMPPFWNKDGFYAAVEKMKHLDYDKLCIAHYGCLQRGDAEKFLDETIKTYEAWWGIFSDADEKNKLDDTGYIKERLLTQIGHELPDLEVSKASMRFMLSMVNTVKKIMGKPPVKVADLQMDGIIGWLAKGYRGATG
jgi:glyoxylase-like metal-dependent hydrolase (beta-lactamase superfamily II)